MGRVLSCQTGAVCPLRWAPLVSALVGTAGCEGDGDSQRSIVALGRGPEYNTSEVGGSAQYEHLVPLCLPSYEQRRSHRHHGPGERMDR